MCSSDSNSTIPCCPQLSTQGNCDTLVFCRVLNYPVSYTPPKGKEELRGMAQLILQFKLSKCTKGLVLGDPVYSTTLLPGETVKLKSTTNRSQFSYDTSTQIASFSQQMSEDQYFMLATQTYLSQMEAQQSGSASSSDKSSWNFSGDASAGLDLLSLGGSASTNASGSSNSSSLSDYLNNQSSNMAAAASQGVQATNVANSVSIGDVTSRTHTEGESEDQYESSSKTYTNNNPCAAVTYMFYRINKLVVVKFEIVGISINVVPSLNITNLSASAIALERAAIVAQVTKELEAAGVLGADGKLSQQTMDEFNSESDYTLPTPGIQVKGCLDDCNTCDPLRKERLQLENDLLRKQIDLLAQSQEYRCCPPPPCGCQEPAATGS